MLRLPDRNQVDGSRLGPEQNGDSDRPRLGDWKWVVVAGSVWLVVVVHLTFGGLVAALVALFLLSVFAHVTSTWLGHRLRDQADRRLRLGWMHRARHRLRPDRRAAGAIAQARRAGNYLRMARSPLVPIVAGIVLGSLAGGAVGSALLHANQVRPLSWFAFAYGLFAFIVLGGLGGWALSGFLTVVWRSFRQAVRFERAALHNTRRRKQRRPRRDPHQDFMPRMDQPND